MKAETKNVLLISAPDVNEVEPFKSAARKQLPLGIGFPIGLGYIAAYLRERGNYDVRILDAIHQKSSIGEVINDIRLFSPDYIGITSFTVNVKAAVELARQIRSIWGKKMVVIAGGPHASEDYENLLRNYPYFDYVVLGEGEKTMLSLLQSLDRDDRSAARSVPGIAFLLDGQVITTGRALIAQDLDDLPFPARDLVNFNTYIGRESTLPYQVEMMTSRGCTHRCAFCSFQKRWRGRDPGNVVREMRHLVAAYPRIKSFAFMDDDFSASKRRVMSLCERIVAEGLDAYRWSCSCRVDQVDKEMLELMKRAGCAKILYGLESADPQVLETLNKKIDTDTVASAVNLTAEVGIDTIVFLIAGNPGETQETLQRTYDFVKTLDCPAFSWGVMQVFPGTALAKMQHQEDFVAYVYEPEILRPNASINANIATFTNAGLNREQLIQANRKYLRKLVIYKMSHHPVFAIRKLWRMPRIAVRLFLWIMGISKRP